MSPRTLPELLDRTRAALEKHGWCQRVLRDSQGHLCLLGAVRIAILGEGMDIVRGPWGSDQSAEYRLLERALDNALLRTSKTTDSLARFNDARTTTLDDVLSLVASAKAET